MADDFFSDEELRSQAYRVCVGAAVVAGYASGAVVAGVGALPTGGASLLMMGAGTALGAAVGKRICPLISRKMLERLQSPQARLSPADVRRLVRDVRVSHAAMSRQDALNQLAAMRLNAVRPARA